MNKLKSRRTGRIINYIGKENNIHYFEWDDSHILSVWDDNVGDEKFSEYFQ